MDDYTNELIEKQLIVGLRVGFDAVDGKHQISRDFICLAVVKRDDVGVVIVLQVGFVHLEQVIVRAEHDSEFTNGFPMSSRKIVNPRSDLASVGAPKSVVGIVELECQG
jgi:hypothetical protein